MITQQHIGFAKALCMAYLHERPLTYPDGQIDNQEDFINYLKRQKLISIAHRQKEFLANYLTPSSIDHIIRSTEIKTHKNLHLFKCAAEVQKLFKAENIWVKPYKGVHFAHTFYPDISLRPSDDVDFAISREDIPKIGTLMKELGYNTEEEIVSIKTLKKSRAYYLDYQWKRKGPFRIDHIEFHLSPAHKALYLPYDFNSSNLDERDSFNKIEHALLVIIHHGFVDIWGKLLHLVDLYQIHKTLSPAEHEQLYLRCKELGISNFLRLGYEMLNHIFKLKLPPNAGNVNDSLLNKISCACLEGRLDGKWSQNRNKINYHLSLRANSGDVLRSYLSLSRFGLYRYFSF